MLPLVVFARLTADSPLWGADGPPLRLEFVPETMSSLEVRRGELRTVRHLGADSPPLGRRQSAVESRILSRGVAVSGGLDT